MSLLVHPASVEGLNLGRSEDSSLLVVAMDGGEFCVCWEEEVRNEVKCLSSQFLLVSLKKHLYQQRLGCDRSRNKNGKEATDCIPGQRN